MSTVIGDLLPLAVGVAISPIPVIAAILMLPPGSARRREIARDAARGRRRSEPLACTPVTPALAARGECAHEVAVAA
jgi:hypothetical protein